MANLDYDMAWELPFSTLMDINLKEERDRRESTGRRFVFPARNGLSSGANAREALVEFHDRRASKRSAFVSNEQNGARQLSENASPSSAPFADDEGSFPIETDHEFKRRRIAETKVGVGAHGKLLLRYA